jgi:Rhs element Vgr protein
MNLIPRSTSLATFTVKVNGSALAGTYRVVTIEVQRELDRVTSARLVLQDGSASDQTFAASEGPDLVPGTDIEVDAGYSRQESRIFKGVITRQRIEVSRRGDSFLHIEAKDPVFRASLARRSRNFTDLSDADAIAEVLKVEGVTVTIESGEAQPQIVQHQATDWDFALQRAGTLGLVCDCDGGEVRFFTPDFAQAATEQFEFGRDIHRCDLELDAESQFTAVEAGAWAPADQELLLSEAATAPSPADAATPDLPAVGNAKDAPRHAGARSQAVLDGWSAARFARSRLAAVRGVVEVQGTELPLPGAVIELKGVGARFNGKAFISGVRHEIARGDWMTSLQLGLDPRLYCERRPQAAAPLAAGHIPPVHGLQIGVVSALEGDPASEDRIEVRLVTVSETDGLVWARIAAFDAGADRGAVFRPEIGDEVVLGFIDGDPRDPVVLGALHSSAKAAPIPGSDDNHEKGYVSRAGMRLVFDDDKPSVTIETPGGAKLTIDDDAKTLQLADQNGNTIKMDNSTLEITAAADLKLKAGANLTIEGVNMSMKASASAALEGSASAKLESGGQATVKGSVVMIN